MKKNITMNSRLLKFSLSSFIFFCAGTFQVYSQGMPMKKDTAVATKNPAINKEGKEEAEIEIPHAFFTHMGMPEGVGMYNLRTMALLTTADGKTTGDFAFHFETGITKNLGVHIRNDRFLYNTHTEIMFQFAVIKSKDGESGFSPIIEFEIPTKKGASRINSLIGFTTAFVRPQFAFNQVLHYNPREDMIDGSASLVYKISRKIFLVVEVLGEKMPAQSAVIDLLAGIKIRLTPNINIGFGYRGPVTNNKEFSSQYIFQPEFGWKGRMK